jgi:fibronectin-binding autotransporter adhesin
MTQSSYQKITLTSDITLSWPFSFQGGSVIYDINNVDASAGPFKITLPDATLASPGQNILFNNISLHTFQIMNNDGVTSVTTVTAGEVFYLYLSDTSTANGIWTPIPFGGGVSTINSVIAKSTNNTVVITGGTLTPPGGTIDFSLPPSVSNLISDVTTTTPGFLVAKTTDPLTYTTRALLGGGNIIVSNDDGVATDPIFGLSSALEGLASIAVGDLQLSGELITTNVVNGGVQLSSADTGKVSINGAQIDTSANITGVNNLTLNGSLTVTGSFSTPTAPKVIFNFTDTPGPAANTITELSQYNVDSVTGSNGIYVIKFATPFAPEVTNYAVTFGSGSNSGTPAANHVYVTLTTPEAVTIAVIDGSGVLVPYSPYGIWGTIWLPT